MTNEELPSFRFKENEELERMGYREERAYETYTDDDHRIWRELFDRQMKILKKRSVPEFFDNQEHLEIERSKMPNYNELSDLLKSTTGWETVPVPGLIPGEHFFKYLANKKFPVTNWIRSREQMDYIVEPDAFHDIFGHLPMLVDPVFADYVQQYGKEAQKAMKLTEKTGIDVSTALARVYWFTVEFGLISTKNGLRIYGAGIQSSKEESIYSLESDKPRRIEFDLERAMRTDYDFTNLQTNYFVIDSYEQLLEDTGPKSLEEAYKIIIENNYSYSNTEALDMDKIVPPNKIKHFY